jgi:hypothetical protein
MPESGPRAQARKELRSYDNPNNGRNKNFKNSDYLEQLLKKYNMPEVELRKWVLEKTRKGTRA